MDAADEFEGSTTLLHHCQIGNIIFLRRISGEVFAEEAPLA
jgi:hypothetical protein